MIIKIDMEEFNALSEEISNIESVIELKKEELEKAKKKREKLFPKGYWWTSDIDRHWKRPKKYSIREVGDYGVTVKEVFKKAPWEGFDGKTYLPLEKLLKINTYKTEEEAKRAVYNRICPKCGGVMKYTTNDWCDKCIDERRSRAREYEKNNKYYNLDKKLVYTVGYTDELTRDRDKGFGGHRFVFKRLDTGEIIESDNLISSFGANGNVDNLPLIEFIEE